MELIRYLLPHLLAGCIGGLVAAAGLVVCNVGGLRELILHSEDGWLAYALLSFGFVVTFGSAAIGHAVISIGFDED
jgi:hypothetical protein